MTQLAGPDDAQVKALKPGAVGLGMGGVAPGEILPSEQPLAIEAAAVQRPLLLTDRTRAGPPIDRDEDAAPHARADSKADISITTQIAASGSATAAAADLEVGIEEGRTASPVATVQPVVLQAEMLITVD